MAQDRAGRSLGAVRSAEAGPTVLLVAGLHGNEPAGLLAAGRVLDRLAHLALRGEVVALAGNLAALERRVRYVDQDLNRMWRGTPATSNGAVHVASVEAKELAALRGDVEAVSARARGPRLAIDLHTTSSTSAPFALCGDTPDSERLAAAVPLPFVFGLEDHLAGTMLAWLARRGWQTLGVEGGRHDDPVSVDRLEQVLVVALVAAGSIDRSEVPDYDDLVDALRDATEDLPRAVSVRYRHAIAPDDRFAMRPGFANFAEVRAQQTVADDARGEVRVAEGGRLLMPLYQGLGEEGFFVVRPLGEPED